MAQLPLPSSNLPCGFCQNIWTSPRYFGDNDRFSFIVSRSLSDWTESADLGCPLCWWILHSPHCHQRNEWSMRMNFVLAPGLGSLTFEFYRSGDDSMLILGPKNISSEKQKLIIFNLVADEGNPAAKRVKLRPAPSVSAEATLQQACVWLSECNKWHTSTCPEPESSFMPLRLLDVTTSSASSHLSAKASSTSPDSATIDRVYLSNNCDGSVVSRSYAALTYCWGTSGKQLCTTRSNIERFTTEGILIAQLPQTIQDAVIVTRSLGLQFLWVDAFCIAQDDEEEQAREIARMAKIYRNAWVTISAAVASKVQDGFLGDRENWSGEKLAPIYLPWKMGEDGEMGTLGLLHNIMFPFRFQDSIHSRAWTMQETLLSTRVLVFSKQQVYFTCLGHTVKTIGGNSTAIHKLRRPLEAIPQKPKDSKQSRKPTGTEWNDIIVEYSARELSFAGDKLLALSSIASMYGKPENYLAGLWRDGLPDNLLWRPSGEAESCRRNIEGRAPSWSWMSIDGPVSVSNPDMGIRCRLRTIIKDCQTTPKHEFNQFGPVIDATLLVQGILTDIAFDPRTYKIYHCKSSHKVPGDLERVIGEGLLDTIDDRHAMEQAAALTTDQRTILAALPFYVVDYYDETSERAIDRAVIGLILEAVVDEASYRRIGTFRSLASTMVDFCQNLSDFYEADVCPDYDYSEFLVDPTVRPCDADASETVHEGVKCNGAQCMDAARSSTTPYTGIKGPRYWCIRCEKNYCEWCKYDPNVHYNELWDAANSFHRWLRLPLPVKESFFKSPEWRNNPRDIIWEPSEIRII